MVALRGPVTANLGPARHEVGRRARRRPNPRPLHRDPAVQAKDAMTTDWARLASDVLARIANRIENEVPNVNRVVYNITSKRPGTIEREQARVSRRRAIPNDVEKDVLVASLRRCCLCYFVSGIKNDRMGQIAHLSQDASDTSFDDLVFLCLEHHAEFDSRSRQSKGYTKAEVKHHRDELYKELERIGEAADATAPEDAAGGQPVGDQVSTTVSQTLINVADRPRFTVVLTSSVRVANAFEPEFSIEQVSGTPMGKIEWRIRGAKFEMDWRQAAVASLPRTSVTGRFDLTRTASEESTVGLDQMGVEIRFSWLGEHHVELHRWPIGVRRDGGKELVEVGEEVLPPLEVDNDHVHGHLDYCQECSRVACYRCGYWYHLANECSNCGFPYTNE